MPWSLRAPFLHKRVSFSHEQEVRAIISCQQHKPTDKPDVVTVDYSKDVCDVGMPFPVDPVKLIQEVVVSPYAEPWIHELVVTVSKRYGLGSVVIPSGMVKTPVW